MAWYSLWSLVAGFSIYFSHVFFIFARIFQGMGPALTISNGLAILGQFYSLGPRKNMSFTWFGGTAPFGAIAGFLLEGSFPWSRGLGSTGAKLLLLPLYLRSLRGRFPTSYKTRKIWTNS